MGPRLQAVGSTCAHDIGCEVVLEAAVSKHVGGMRMCQGGT